MSHSTKPKAGRPPLPGRPKYIRLRSSTFELWRQRKEQSGYENNTDSEFAEYLLHAAINRSETVTDTNRFQGTPIQKKYSAVASPSLDFLTSTPAKPQRQLHRKRTLQLTSQVHTRSMGESSNIDVTGLSSENDQNPFETTIDRLKSENPMFGTLLGDPFAELDRNLESISESESSDECHYNFQSSKVEQELSKLLLGSDESESESSEDDRIEEWNKDINTEPMDMDISEADSEATLTAIFVDEEYGVGSSADPDKASSCGEVVMEEAEEKDGCEESEQEKRESLKEKMVQLLSKMLNDEKAEVEDKLTFVKKDRIIVEIDQLMQFFEKKCLEKECSASCGVTSKKVEAGVLQVCWKCEAGHMGKWASSSIFGYHNSQPLFTVTTTIAAGIIISGNNFEKMKMFADFTNLHFISERTNYRIQTLFAIPEIKKFWELMQKILLDLFTSEDMILCGDGRNDSPGHSAKFCVYSLMEHFLNVIVDVEIVDVRQTKGSSTNMETFALRKLLERIMSQLKIKELVTDASRSVGALVKELKDKHPEYLSDMFHSLDIWHKACKITAKLSKASRVKGCEKVKQWIEPIRNHFWYCAENCEGDEVKIKSMWLGIAHHICGEHEWFDPEAGQCEHGPLTDLEQEKTYLEPNSKAAEAIKTVVTDVQWLTSLKHYIKFRHTSNLENFHSMMLKYAPKRIGFQNDAFEARVLLAAVDHNSHLFRKPLVGASGKIQYCTQYSKRSKNWQVREVKEPKLYLYWPLLAANILAARVSLRGSVTEHVSVREDHPKKKFQTIAMKEVPSTAELVKAKLSRFTKKDDNQ